MLESARRDTDANGGNKITGCGAEGSSEEITINRKFTYKRPRLCGLPSSSYLGSNSLETLMPRQAMSQPLSALASTSVPGGSKASKCFKLEDVELPSMIAIDGSRQEEEIKKTRRSDKHITSVAPRTSLSSLEGVPNSNSALKYQEVSCIIKSSLAESILVTSSPDMSSDTTHKRRATGQQYKDIYCSCSQDLFISQKHIQTSLQNNIDNDVFPDMIQSCHSRRTEPPNVAQVSHFLSPTEKREGRKHPHTLLTELPEAVVTLQPTIPKNSTSFKCLDLTPDRGTPTKYQNMTFSPLQKDVFDIPHQKYIPRELSGNQKKVIRRNSKLVTRGTELDSPSRFTTIMRAPDGRKNVTSVTSASSVGNVVSSPDLSLRLKSKDISWWGNVSSRVRSKCKASKPVQCGVPSSCIAGMGRPSSKSTNGGTRPSQSHDQRVPSSQPVCKSTDNQKFPSVSGSSFQTTAAKPASSGTSHSKISVKSPETIANNVSSEAICKNYSPLCINNNIDASARFVDITMSVSNRLGKDKVSQPVVSNLSSQNLENSVLLPQTTNTEMSPQTVALIDEESVLPLPKTFSGTESSSCLQISLPQSWDHNFITSPQTGMSVEDAGALEKGRSVAETVAENSPPVKHKSSPGASVKYWPTGTSVKDKTPAGAQKKDRSSARAPVKVKSLAGAHIAYKSPAGVPVKARLLGGTLLFNCRSVGTAMNSWGFLEEINQMNRSPCGTKVKSNVLRIKQEVESPELVNDIRTVAGDYSSLHSSFMNSSCCVMPVYNDLSEYCKPFWSVIWHKFRTMVLIHEGALEYLPENIQHRMRSQCYYREWHHSHVPQCDNCLARNCAFSEAHQNKKTYVHQRLHSIEGSQTSVLSGKGGHENIRNQPLHSGSDTNKFSASNMGKTGKEKQMSKSKSQEGTVSPDVHTTKPEVYISITDSEEANLTDKNATETGKIKPSATNLVCDTDRNQPCNKKNNTCELKVSDVNKISTSLPNIHKVRQSTQHNVPQESQDYLTKNIIFHKTRMVNEVLNPVHQEQNAPVETSKLKATKRKHMIGLCCSVDRMLECKQNPDSADERVILNGTCKGANILEENNGKQSRDSEAKNVKYRMVETRRKSVESSTQGFHVTLSNEGSVTEAVLMDSTDVSSEARPLLVVQKQSKMRLKKVHQTSNDKTFSKGVTSDILSSGFSSPLRSRMENGSNIMLNKMAHDSVQQGVFLESEHMKQIHLNLCEDSLCNPESLGYSVKRKICEPLPVDSLINKFKLETHIRNISLVPRHDSGNTHCHISESKGKLFNKTRTQVFPGRMDNKVKIPSQTMKRAKTKSILTYLPLLSEALQYLPETDVCDMRKWEDTLEEDQLSAGLEEQNLFQIPDDKSKLESEGLISESFRSNCSVSESSRNSMNNGSWSMGPGVGSSEGSMGPGIGSSEGSMGPGVGSSEGWSTTSWLSQDDLADFDLSKTLNNLSTVNGGTQDNVVENKNKKLNTESDEEFQSERKIVKKKYWPLQKLGSSREQNFVLPEAIEFESVPSKRNNERQEIKRANNESLEVINESCIERNCDRKRKHSDESDCESEPDSDVKETVSNKKTNKQTLLPEEEMKECFFEKVRSSCLQEKTNFSRNIWDKRFKNSKTQRWQWRNQKSKKYLKKGSVISKKNENDKVKYIKEVYFDKEVYRSHRGKGQAVKKLRRFNVEIRSRECKNQENAREICAGMVDSGKKINENSTSTELTSKAVPVDKVEMNRQLRSKNFEIEKLEREKKNFEEYFDDENNVSKSEQRLMYDHVNIIPLLPHNINRKVVVDKYKNLVSQKRLCNFMASKLT